MYYEEQRLSLKYVLNDFERHITNRYRPERSCSIIAACIVLHNMAIHRRIPLPDDDGPQPNPQPEAALLNGVQVATNGKATRDALVQRWFTA